MILTFTGALLLSTMVMSTQVRADINENEQNLISFASAIHEYNGKQYKATDSALSQLRSYLDQADRNLTAAQAEDAMNQFSSKLPQAISDGYMVQVGGNPGSSTPPTVTIIDPNNNIIEVPAPDTTTPETTPTTDVTTMVDTLVVGGAATTPSNEVTTVVPKKETAKTDQTTNATKKTTSSTSKKTTSGVSNTTNDLTSDTTTDEATDKEEELLIAQAATDVETIDKEIDLASTQSVKPVVTGTVDGTVAAISTPFYKNTTFLLIAGFVAAVIIIVSIAGVIIFQVKKKDPFGSL